MGDHTRGPGPEHLLEARVEAMAETIGELRAELAAMRATGRSSSAEDSPAPPDGARADEPPSSASRPEVGDRPAEGRISRRGAIVLGAAAVAGIGAAADSVLSPTPAWATTGNMQYGAGNNAGTAETTLTAAATSATLSITNTSSGNGLFVTSAEASQTLASFNTGPGTAIAGLSTDGSSTVPCVTGQHQGAGAGVTGESATGYGLTAQGGLAPLLLTPAATTGAPASGAHALGELYVDSAGVLYSCQAAGTPGTWAPVLAGGSTNQAGADTTFLVSSDGEAAFWVKNPGSGCAVAGTDDATGTGAAIIGQLFNAANPEAAVAGITAGTGPGLFGDSGGSYGAQLLGGLAPLCLYPSATAGPPTTGAHILGEIYVDSGGVLYSCLTAGTPGTWGPVLVGGATTQEANGQTVLAADTPGVTFWARNTGTGYALAGTDEGTGTGGGVVGQLTNPANNASAVYGQTAGEGAAISGFSLGASYGAALGGGLAPLFLVPAAAGGAPTTGTHQLGELYVDSGGVLYACQAAGTPGTWGPVVVGGAPNNAGAGETDLTSTSPTETLSVTNTGTGIALNGKVLDATSTSSAVYASTTGLGVAVFGLSTNPASQVAAVVGHSDGKGPGVDGYSAGGYGLAGDGALAPLWLVPSGTAGPPTAGAHVLGELYVDADGVQYRCAAAGTPGTWVPQYSVVPLPAPVRVIATPTAVGGITGPLVPGATVHTSSVLTGANGIPAGAIGVVANLAVSGVGGALLNGYGVMTVFPAGDAVPATANINAGAGCFALSNTVTVAFGTGANAGKVSIVWNGGGPVPNAQAYLDVTAYLL